MALATLVCAGLVLLTQLYVAIPLAPDVARDLGSHDASVVMTTAFAVPYAAGLILFGTLSDHYGRKRVLVPGLVASAAAALAVALAPSMTALGVLRALQGAAASTFPAAANAYVAGAFPPTTRTKAVGRLQGAYLAAAVVGQLYATALAELAGWRGTFQVSAGVLLAVALACSRVLAADGAAGSPRLLELLSGIPRLLHRREVGLLCLAAVALLLPLVAMFTALEPRVSDTFGLESTSAGALRLAALPGLTVTLVVGPVADRLGLTRLAVCGLVGAAVGLVAVGVATDLWLLVTGIFVLGAGIGAAVPSMVTLLLRRAPCAAGTAASLYAAVVFLGAGLAPALTGLDLGFTTLMLGLAATTGAAAVAVLLSGTPRPALTPYCAARSR